MTAFEDLDDDPGDEALDELSETLSGDSDDSEQQETTDDAPAYDPQTDPAFPSAKKQTQHSLYCLPSTWEDVDGSDGLLFNAEIALRREGWGEVQKRELHNALLSAAVESVSPEDVAEELIATREERADGPLLD